MDWKKTGKKLLFPPVWLMLLLTVFSTTGLVFVFLRGMEEHPVAYAVYVTAFYTLTVVVVFCVRVLPKQCRQIRLRILSNPIGNRYLTDRAFRTGVSLHVSLGINLMYVAMNVALWYLYQSWWFVTLAVYYVILSLMRFLLVRYFRKTGIGSSLMGEWKRARSCACILLLINVSLCGAVLMILYQNRGFEYHGMLIYVMALYTFYSTIHAIVDIVRYRKLGSPVLSTAKIVSLSAALVSMLSLETAMFSQFGSEMAVQDQQLMIMLTGAGVSIVVVTLSIRLILRANKEIRRMKNGE